MSVDFNTLARQFCEFYYNKFDSDRNQLGNLYRDHSMLTFEQSQVQGAKNIVEKLASMSFQRVEHSITTLDAQPASPSGDAVIVMVTGQLKMDDDPPKGFAQVFHLLSDGPGSYYVFNDIFRLQF